MASPFIYSKVAEQDTIIQVDVSSMLLPTQTITAITLSAAQPTTTPPLTGTVNSGLSPQINITLSGGLSGTSYGFKLQVMTNTGPFILTVACLVTDPEFVPYVTSNPDAFQDLVDEIEAGKAALGTAVFAFPADVDPRGGFVTWELLDSDGAVFAAGNAFEYNIRSDGISNTVIARSIINVPVTVPPSLDGQKYQLRYTLDLEQSLGLPGDPLQGQPAQNRYFQFENIRVVGLNTVPLGTEPQAELQGVPATMSIVLDKLYDNVTVELWAGGQQLAPPAPITDYQRVANGWYYAGVIDTSQLMVSLVPYQVVWKYWNTSTANYIEQDRADLFIINPSILSAVNDMKQKINKARTTLYGTPDLLYPVPTCLTWLRRGADAFNIAYGQFTSFTFTNALGGIREFWLLEAEMAAIEAQYLAEGEKAFNFQGAAISLDVDRTQFLRDAASVIQARLDNELKSIKVNLIIKGNTGGDGSQDPSKLQQGAMGTVGITITPATMWGRFPPSYAGSWIK